MSGFEKFLTTVVVFLLVVVIPGGLIIWGSYKYVTNKRQKSRDSGKE